MSTITPSKQNQTARVIFNPALFEEHASQLAEQAASQFRKITRSHALFHCGFFLLGLVEVLGLLLFFPFFAKSSLLAFSIATLFLTGFSYFVLRFYFEGKKPEQFLSLREQCITSFKKGLPAALDRATYHLSLTHAVYRLINKLEGQETQYYPLPFQFKTLTPLLQKFSLWCHWRDVHEMKELLHQFCIEERIEQVKEEPTDIEVHALLANAYIAFYKECLPEKIPLLVRKHADLNRFTLIAKKALEEFKIIDTYAPNDPWVHAQLASIYHDLKMPEKEIEAYETLLRISSQDQELLFRCGSLYFQQGHTAQGLRIYEQLKKQKDPRAKELIAFYNA